VDAMRGVADSLGLAGVAGAPQAGAS
jgi:hypothetical protein